MLLLKGWPLNQGGQLHSRTRWRGGRGCGGQGCSACHPPGWCSTFCQAAAQRMPQRRPHIWTNHALALPPPCQASSARAPTRRPWQRGARARLTAAKVRSLGGVGAGAAAGGAAELPTSNAAASHPLHVPLRLKLHVPARAWRQAHAVPRHQTHPRPAGAGRKEDLRAPRASSAGSSQPPPGAQFEAAQQVPQRVDCGMAYILA